MGFEVTGLSELISQIERTEDEVIPMAKMAVYDGAGIIADAVRSELKKVLSGDSTGDLENSLGIQRIVTTAGAAETVVGFAGYDRNGVPNPLKARVLNSGRSYTNHKKTRFVSKAVKKAQETAQSKMEETFREEFDKRFNI